MRGSDGTGLVGPLLIAVGLFAVVGSMTGGLWMMGGVGGSEYVHTLATVGDQRCSATGPAAEQYRYGELSPRGQDIVDRADDDPGTTVITEEPVPAFEYGTAIDPADPQYVRAHDDCYELHAEQSGIGEPGVVIQVTVNAVLGLVAVLGIVAAAIGTIKYGDH